MVQLFIILAGFTLLSAIVRSLPAFLQARRHGARGAPRHGLAGLLAAAWGRRAVWGTYLTAAAALYWAQNLFLPSGPPPVGYVPSADWAHAALGVLPPAWRTVLIKRPCEIALLVAFPLTVGLLHLLPVLPARWRAFAVRAHTAMG